MEEVARNIVRKNLSLKEGEITLIECGPKSLEFAESLAYEASMVGAQPTIIYSSDKLALRVYRDIKITFLKKKPKLYKILSQKVDAKIIIDDTDPFLSRKIPQNKIEIRRRVTKPIRRIEEERQKRKDMKAVLVGFPTEEQARMMGISYRKLKKIFWSAMNVDYEKLYEYNEKVISAFKGAETIRVVGKKTDISFSIKGRRFINACGLFEKETMGYLNLPDGEVFLPPVENSVEGEIYFDLPCMWHYGKKVKGVWFRFENGRLKEFHVEKGEKNFRDVYENASGDKDKIGEFAIGTNPKARITGGMIIVDEKVRGTIHMAIGHNKHFGGRNDSTIHWDFFKDMRKGRIYADENLVMENGKIV